MRVRSSPPSDAVVIPDRRGPDAAESALGDFSVTTTVVRLALLAAAIGAAVALVALVLLDLIGLITNLAYTGRWDTTLSAPDTHVLGVASALVPIAGGFVVGLMARYGSERI